MAAADGRHVERHFAIAAAADDRPIAVDRIPRRRSTLSHKFQKMPSLDCRQPDRERTSRRRRVALPGQACTWTCADMRDSIESLRHRDPRRADILGRVSRERQLAGSATAWLGSKAAVRSCPGSDDPAVARRSAARLHPPVELTYGRAPAIRDGPANNRSAAVGLDPRHCGVR